MPLPSSTNRNPKPRNLHRFADRQDRRR